VTDFVAAAFYEGWYVPKLRRSLSSLLAGAKRSILEVGAGTGLVTALLAEVTPAGIFALEPGLKRTVALAGEAACQPLTARAGRGRSSPRSPAAAGG
jgi:hypothetical protein